MLEEDNIDEGSPYFYLTELAAKCTSKRLVPDYISEKKMMELKEGNCFPVMGCRSALSPWKDEEGNYKMSTNLVSASGSTDADSSGDAVSNPDAPAPLEDDEAETTEDNDEETDGITNEEAGLE